MATNVEYALMAANVYDAVRTDANDIPVPPGWDRIRYIADGPRPQGPAERNNFGFSAGVFRRGNEVVIAFTGSNEAIDWLTNVRLGTDGSLVTQLTNAVELVLQVKRTKWGRNKKGTEPGFLSGAGGTETGLRPY